MRAQSAATVPSSSSVYDRLESVSALFPARGIHLGQRSLSRRDLQRSVARLRAAIDSAPPGPATRRQWARQELAAVAAALASERGLYRASRLTVGGAWRAESFASDARSERITNNGLGELDAVTHPFAAGREGWSTGQGNVVTLAPTGVLGLGDGFAVAVEPRTSIGHFRDRARAEDAFVHRAYARGVFRNVALQVGADELRWGQSPLGALFISGNASPLPALMIGTDTPITLPWLFRIVGPVRMTALLADLGKSQDPPHAKLAGWQASLQPWSRFELGVAVLSQMGGSGGPKATFIERLVDLFPAIDALAPQHADLQISNKLAGGNLRLRVPELSGLDFYYELQIDDFDGRRLRSSLVEDAAHLLGARLPLLLRDGQLTWRAEWHRTSLRLYEHSQFRSGVTYRGHLIGNPLGPHATGAYLSATWRRSPLSAVEIGLVDERRDPSLYTVPSSTRDTAFRFIRLTNDPDHRRRRAIASIERTVGGAALRFTAGYNRAWRTGQAARGEWLALLAFRGQQLPTF